MCMWDADLKRAGEASVSCANQTDAGRELREEARPALEEQEKTSVSCADRTDAGREL